MQEEFFGLFGSDPRTDPISELGDRIRPLSGPPPSLRHPKQHKRPRSLCSRRRASPRRRLVRGRRRRRRRSFINMQETAVEEPGELATPGDVLGRASEVKPGRGAYLAPHSDLVYASLTGRVRTVPPPARFA
ncbi:hypothetical protein NL676_030984 [Syzygium grande]|nr:hypothetical protein NL676_030984 [Syzygium grande]